MKHMQKEEELIRTEGEGEMINRLLGGLIGFVGNRVDATRQLYNNDQRRVLLELERSYRRQYEEEYGFSSSSLSSWQASSTSRSTVKKEGTKYFESLEKRLGIKEEEFFKKEEFDVE